MNEELIKWKDRKSVLFFSPDYDGVYDKEYVEKYVQLSISGFGMDVLHKHDFYKDSFLKLK